MIYITVIRAIREKNTWEVGQSMKFGKIVVYVMQNIFSYGPNLNIEIGGYGGHFKNGGRWISIKYFKQS